MDINGRAGSVGEAEAGRRHSGCARLRGRDPRVLWNGPCVSKARQAEDVAIKNLKDAFGCSS